MEFVYGEFEHEEGEAAVEPNARYDDFEAALQEELKKNSGGRSYALGDTLVPILVDLLSGILTNCLSGLGGGAGTTSNAQAVAERACAPSLLDKRRMAVAIKSRVYGGSWIEYRADTGDRLVTSLFGACSALGPVKLAAVLGDKEVATDWSA